MSSLISASQSLFVLLFTESVCVIVCIDVQDSFGGKVAQEEAELSADHKQQWQAVG